MWTAVVFCLLFYHCFHHLWFSIRWLRRWLYSQKSQDAKRSRCLKPLFHPKGRRVFDHHSILIQKVAVFLEGCWHHKLKRRQYRNGESNIKQCIIFVLCTQKQLFYDYICTQHDIYKMMPPPDGNFHFLSSYPRCRRKQVIFD